MEHLLVDRSYDALETLEYAISKGVEVHYPAHSEQKGTK